MKLKIEIELDNDAFRVNDNFQAVTECLDQVSHDFARIGLLGEKNSIRDINGNTVGYWIVKL
jgi:hypothetical protein